MVQMFVLTYFPRTYMHHNYKQWLQKHQLEQIPSHNGGLFFQSGDKTDAWRFSEMREIVHYYKW